MLRVVYEAASDLKAGQTVDIRESRGLIKIKIDQGAVAEEFTQALNPALQQLLAGCGWFQLWNGEILSANSPGSPLRVEYEVDDRMDRQKIVEIREARGLVKLHVSSAANADEFVQALNPAIETFLAGGQWFQLWEGEIITMDSPDDLAA